MIEVSAAPLDRDLQRRILVALAELYPAAMALPDLSPQFRAEPLFVRNLMYLSGHGLVVASAVRKSPASMPEILRAEITPRGLDFLADDGGLTAILGVVTVKLHDDTIRQIMLDAVDAAEAPDGIKEKLRAAITDLPADGVKAAVPALLRQALDAAPEAIRLIGKSLGL
ncbi:hypothetical protein SAMN05421774_11229 [Gemmobacter megaterium]|uniref:Uncharacterized protein n=1 Tax=Gemmobacter megaterium TaxID=1086013 RepID=A0A1N7QJD6_9RHOB|nr:hypothetical protein [Gemmobacter megaterium]GGE26776.1 hypothetical protein GCM10011345_35980 [Gemmobacter megaterium]SIT22617.1 hypothetical protein SAMN05421774_11229 [Gemmobacter megaterium]